MSNTLGYYFINDYDVCRKKNEYFHFMKRIFWSPPFGSSFRKVRDTDECPICCSSFLNFSHTWVTRCGHVFHKQCLYEYLMTQLLKDDYSSCPLCRQVMGNLEFVDGWMYQVGIETQSQCDLLEELCHLLPIVCPYGDASHFLGMKKDCDTCLVWRRSGKISPPVITPLKS